MFMNEREASGAVTLQGIEVEQFHEIKCLRSTSEQEVKKQVLAGWRGWRKESGVISDKRVAAN